MKIFTKIYNFIFKNKKEIQKNKEFKISTESSVKDPAFGITFCEKENILIVPALFFRTFNELKIFEIDRMVDYIHSFKYTIGYYLNLDKDKLSQSLEELINLLEKHNLIERKNYRKDENRKFGALKPPIQNV